MFAIVLHCIQCTRGSSLASRPAFPGRATLKRRRSPRPLPLPHHHIHTHNRTPLPSLPAALALHLQV